MRTSILLLYSFCLQPHLPSLYWSAKLRFSHIKISPCNCGFDFASFAERPEDATQNSDSSTNEGFISPKLSGTCMSFVT